MSVISPEMRAILQTQLVSAGTDLSTRDIREARLAFDAAAAGWNVPLPDLDSENTVLDGVHCRVLVPASRKEVP